MFVAMEYQRHPDIKKHRAVLSDLRSDMTKTAIALKHNVSRSTVLRIQRKQVKPRKHVGYLIDKKTNCWVWQNGYSTTQCGRHRYGCLKRNGQELKAYRYVYELFRGPIPKHLQLDHLCRNTLCVNPDHLEAVSQSVNSQRGNSAKLNAGQIRTIRKLWADPRNKLNKTKIAHRFNVTDVLIGKIIRREIWSNVA